MGRSIIRVIVFSFKKLFYNFPTILLNLSSRHIEHNCSEFRQLLNFTTLYRTLNFCGLIVGKEGVLLLWVRHCRTLVGSIHFNKKIGHLQLPFKTIWLILWQDSKTS